MIGRDRRVLVAGSMAAVLAVAAVVFFSWQRSSPEEVPPPLGEPPPPEVTETPEIREFQIFFPGQDGLLHAMTRELTVSPEPTENITHLVETLLAGPHGENLAAAELTPKSDNTPEAEPTPKLPAAEPEDGLWPPFAAGITLGQAYLLDDATVILDLVSPEGARPSTGSRTEMLMLYSLVNTVLLNVEEAERLVLLWNGQQPNTFAGHLDATRPFVAANHLIARGGEG